MRAGIVALCLMVAGCDAGPISLIVDLKTDLVAGAEFVVVRTEIDGELAADRRVMLGDDYLGGTRVAERTGLSPGIRDVRVSLLDEAGAVVVSRQVLVQQDVSYGLTVLLTRDCADVVCPGPGDPGDATVCVAGSCTNPGCSDLDRSLCPSAECSASSECPPVDACAESVCDDGVCLARPLSGSCMPDEFCRPESGCEVVPGNDAGAPMPDAGVDAGFDAGLDAGTDAGADAGFDGGFDAGGPPGFLADELSAGGAHTCATRRGSGELYCWGENSSRQLNLTGPEQRLVPTAVPYGVASSVVTYFNHTCATDAAGVVSCWGRGAQMELGVDISPDLFSEPARVVSTLPGGSSLVPGFQSCAIVPGGGLQCWGRNAFGQLGIGRTTPSGGELPMFALTMGPCSDAGVGGEHACAVRDPGDVLCWGRNGNDQLGHGMTGDRSSPTAVMLARDAGWRLGIGEYHSCAVNGSRELWCWGSNGSGQAGIAGGGSLGVPTRVTGVTADEVCAGAEFTCVRDGGAIACSGSNDRGQLGRGALGGAESSFAPVIGIADADRLRCGKHHVCVRLGSGELRCWGEGSAGQLGDGTRDSSGTPVVVREP